MKWPRYSLSQIAVDLQPGFARQPESGDASLPQLRTNNVSVEGRIDLSRVKEVPASRRESELYSLRKGDILFNNTNSAELVGKTAFFDLDGGPYLFSNHMTRIRVNDEIADPRFVARYLYYVWRTGGFQTMVTRWVNQAAINRTSLGGVSVPLPGLSEQRRIVEILDQADALRRKRAEADAKATRILPALFYHMFGDPATNPMEWPIKPLVDHGAHVRYGLGQLPKASEDGTPVIRATNISKGTISAANMIYVDSHEVPPSRDAFLRADEVIVVRSGANTGDAAQVTGEWDGCVAGYDLVVSPGNALAGEFIEAYLLTGFVQEGYFHNLKARAGQSHLNVAQVSATPVPVVPIDLQYKFAQAVQSTRLIRQRTAKVGQDLKLGCAVLMHRAFRGDLTSRWREARMQELLVEMKAQAKAVEAEA